MRRALILIRAASLLLPRRLRAEWCREWSAELYHASARGVGDAQVIRFALGAFHDAFWHGRSHWNEAALRDWTQSAGFCFTALSGAILLIALASGFLPVTRSILLPLPYKDPDRIAILSHRGLALATRSAIGAEQVRLWRKESRLLEGIATYSWSSDTVSDDSGSTTQVQTARVSENFFSLLGGQPAGPRDLDSVIISYDFWQRKLRGKPLTADSSLVLNGQRHRVTGVLDRGFWFLSRQIAVWRIVSPESISTEKTGVVVRLRQDVTNTEAEKELGSILRKAGGINAWESLVEVSPLPDRVHSVFGSFGLALALAIVTTIASSRLRLPKWNPRRAAFFISKTLLSLIAVLLFGLEFTRASFITMLGGTDVLTEPLSAWLFLLGCMGVLLWSIRDQRARCRVCLRRLSMPTRVGCPGCLLLDWAGTELVCVQGHGMLHVPEMVSCWHEPEYWTSLDDSWQGLFEGS